MEIVPAIRNNQTRAHAFFVAENSALRSDDVWSKTNYFLSFVNDPSFRIRLDSMMLLSEIDNTITNGIPALIAALRSRFLVGSAFGGLICPGKSGHGILLRGESKNEAEAIYEVDPDVRPPPGVS
jgi:hypothetical protein